MLFAEIPAISGDAVLTLALAVAVPLMLPSLLLIPPLWKLCARAGFPCWFSFAMVIPLANLTLLYFVAYSDWPSELREHARDRSDGNGKAGEHTTNGSVTASASRSPAALEAEHRR
jgi:hypothetical protein